MTGLLAAVTTGLQEKPVTLAIFAVTYLGIAIGHVPGLKLNRVGKTGDMKRHQGALFWCITMSSGPSQPKSGRGIFSTEQSPGRERQ